MAKKKTPKVRHEYTEAEPMRAWVRRTTRGLRAFRYYHQGHFYKDPRTGAQRKTNWVPVSVELVREFALKGTAILCNRDNTVLVATLAGAQGFFAFIDGTEEAKGPYVGETFPTGETELNDADKWAMGWRTAESHLRNA